MASVSRPYRLVNPGRKHRSNAGKKRMTLRQKLFFGTKRQRTAARASVGRKRKSNTSKLSTRIKKSRARSYRLDAKRFASISPLRKRHKRNVGAILSVFNPGHEPKNKLVIINPRRKRRKNVAKGSGRVISGYGSTVMNPKRRVMRRRRKNSHRRRNFSLFGRAKRRRVSRRRSNPVVRRRRRRSNPVAHRRS